MKGKIYILFVGLLSVLLSSCVTARKVNYMQEPDKHIPSYADTLSYEEYELRIGDRLYVYVYSLDEQVSSMFNANLNSSYVRYRLQQNTNANSTYGSYDLYTYLIDEEGYIDYPHIGKVYVRGMNTREVKQKLEEELSALLQEIPGFSTVSVEVNIVNRSFSVIGAQSGRYFITKEKMTIFEALALAGDLDEFNSRKEIKLVREKEGVTTVKTFDARSKDLINSEYYYIEPNDIIYVRKIPGYSFGINSASTALGVCATTLSFGVLVYSIVQTGIIHVNKRINGGYNK
ncbi:MAG: polysaccharide biosynthesis/export family protein [Paludibacteraceae bacterium]|nr:polysaccharide biosynthesis/export family protein [Paludibacteraceae bacterium]